MNCLIQFNGCLFNLKIVGKTMLFTIKEENCKEERKSTWNQNQHIFMWELVILIFCFVFSLHSNIWAFTYSHWIDSTTQIPWKLSSPFFLSVQFFFSFWDNVISFKHFISSLLVAKTGQNRQKLF